MNDSKYGNILMDYKETCLHNSGVSIDYILKAYFVIRYKILSVAYHHICSGDLNNEYFLWKVKILSCQRVVLPSVANGKRGFIFGIQQLILHTLASLALCALETCKRLRLCFLTRFY